MMMMNKLSSVVYLPLFLPSLTHFQSNKYNPDKDRKTGLLNILNKMEARNEDDVVYLENYLKTYFTQGLNDIKGKVDQDQWKKVIINPFSHVNKPINH